MKQIEVFLLQLLDIQVALAIALYALDMALDDAGDHASIAARVQEVLLYANSCSYCLLLCVESKSPPKCYVFCTAFYQER